MKTIIALLLLLAAAGIWIANSFRPDFSSTAALNQTCKPLLAVVPGKLAGDAEHVAYFICGAIDLARDATTWFARDKPSLESSDPVARQRTRARAERYLARMSELRIVLEGVKGKGPYFLIEPGTWQIDFNGDGKVSLFERYLFWVPKRGVQTNPFKAQATDELYRSRYTSLVVNVDQSDVYWAIAYVNFAEAALNVALAYDWNPALYQEATLINPERISGAAYPRMQDGISYSMRLHASLLQETHDQHEWIPNPGQVDMAFPLRLDVQTFATWGSLLGEIDGLLRGKTLLGGTVDSAGRRAMLSDLSMGMCPPGEGLDVRALFLQPATRLFDAKQLAAYCAKPTDARPLAGLAELISASLKRNEGTTGAGESSEWTILRHLYWVN